MTSPLRSIRTRLLAGHGALFTVVLLAAFVLLDLMLRQAALRQVDLRTIAEAGRILDLSSRRKPRILQEELDRLTRVAGSDVALYWLADTQGTALAVSGPEAWVHSRPEPPARGTMRRTTVTVEGARIRWTGAADAAGRSIHIARSLREADELVRHARLILLGGLVASLAAGFALAGRITGRALARVDAVRSAAVGIASGDLSRRVPDGETEDEIAALARSFNQMLDRIQALMCELRAVTDDIAHELRTPITRIRCAMEAGLSARPEGDWPAAGAMVIEECDRLARTIDVMLRIAKLEAGRGLSEPGSVDVGAMVQHVAEAFETVALDRGVQLEVIPPPAGLCVTGDPAGLHRALANLVDNAVKYTLPGGGVRIEGRVAGDRVEIAVADTGVGIAADELPRVFDRFFRAGTRPETDGTGLGLCLVRAIVTAHGGSVTVQSTPGAGSTFTIRLAAAG